MKPCDNTHQLTCRGDSQKIEGLILVEIFYLGSFIIDMYVSIVTFNGAMALGDMNEDLF